MAMLTVPNLPDDVHRALRLQSQPTTLPAICKSRGAPSSQSS